METVLPPTKILYICSDASSFAIWECMARVISELPPVELLHAADATEGLTAYELLAPDIIIMDLEIHELDEHQMFQDALNGKEHPPIILHFPNIAEGLEKLDEGRCFYLGRCDTLDGVHKSLLVATSLVASDTPRIEPGSFH